MTHRYRAQPVLVFLCAQSRTIRPVCLSVTNSQSRRVYVRKRQLHLLYKVTVEQLEIKGTAFHLIYFITFLVFSSVNKENVNHVPLDQHKKNAVWSTEMCFIYSITWGERGKLKSQNQVA